MHYLANLSEMSYCQQASCRALQILFGKNSLHQNLHSLSAFYAFKNCRFCTILAIIEFCWSKNALSAAAVAAVNGECTRCALILG